MRRTFNATIPVELELPAEMVEPLRQLFAGEYESRYVGRGLTILDIGANVGAFTLWADLRWPGSTIHAYEPHPGTFAILERNVRALPNVTCRAVAVYPSDKVTEPLHSSFAGDGQAGLVEAMRTTWRSMPDERIVEVAVAHPRDLPRADIVKVDAEGSEGAIVEGLDLSETSLLLVEYQNGEVLGRVQRAVEGLFEVVAHVSYPWSEVLYIPEYRRELEGDRYGTLILVNRRHNRLRHVDEPVPAPNAAPAPAPEAPVTATPTSTPGPELSAEASVTDGPRTPPEPDSLRAALRPLPRLAWAVVRRRLTRGGRHPSRDATHRR